MKLAFLVWAVDWLSTADFFTITDLILLTLLGIACSGFILGIMHAENVIDEEEITELWSGKPGKIFKNLYMCLFVMACLGSIATTFVPDNKNTIYLMVGAYFASEAIEDCNKADTTCNRIKTTLERKITKAIEEVDAEDAKAAAEKVTDKVADKVADEVKKD